MIVKTLVHRGLDQAVVAAQCLASDLLHGEIPLEELLLYKGIKRELHDYAEPVSGHIQLARRQGLKPGDRLVYVLVKANSKALQAEKMESPRSLDADCQISYSEYLERYLVPTFSRLLAIPSTQKVNEIGDRFGDPKESAKDIERRKKATQKAIFENSACCVCRLPLALVQGFPLHLQEGEESSALSRFFASSGARKKKKKQSTLHSLWFPAKGDSSRKGAKTDAPSALVKSKKHEGGGLSDEALGLGMKWFLCKQCVEIVVGERNAAFPGAQKALSEVLLKRRLLPKLSLFRAGDEEPGRTAEGARDTSLLKKHSSRRNTLKRSSSFCAERENKRKKKRQRVVIEYSDKDKDTLKSLVSAQRQKVAAFEKTCRECRQGTGLDPKDCDADSCEQWFSRDLSRQLLGDLEQAHAALCQAPLAPEP